MELQIPKLREGSYFPSLLEPRRRSERALLAVIQQAYVEGVSTRRVDDLVKALGCEGRGGGLDDINRMTYSYTTLWDVTRGASSPLTC